MTNSATTPPAAVNQTVASALRLAAIVAIVCLAGCTRWQYNLGEPIAEASVSSSADLASVLQWLGPPHRIAAGGQGYVMAWEYWQIQENSVGFSLGAVGANVLSFDWGEANIQGEFLLLTFDARHNLLDSAFSVTDSSTGGGVSLMPMIASPGLTNVDELISQMPQHSWGANWLQRLPQALNAASAPDLSGNSIEQRGTGEAAGQRTLEMR